MAYLLASNEAFLARHSHLENAISFPLKHLGSCTMPATLSAGWCSELVNVSADGVMFHEEGMLQVLHAGRPNEREDRPQRFRLVLSDGEHYVQALLSPALGYLVEEGKTVAFSLVEVSRVALGAVGCMGRCVRRFVPPLLRPSVFAKGACHTRNESCRRTRADDREPYDGSAGRSLRSGSFRVNGGWSTKCSGTFQHANAEQSQPFESIFHSKFFHGHAPGVDIDCPTWYLIAHHAQPSRDGVTSSAHTVNSQ